MSTEIGCRRALALPLDELLAAPGSAEGRELMAHAAGCRDCARELLLVREVQGGLRRQLAGAHPTDEALLAFHERVAIEPSAREEIRLHLAACDVCRTTLGAFGHMHRAPGPSGGGAGRSSSAPLVHRRWIGDGASRPALAAALLAIVALPLGLLLWSRASDRVGGPATERAGELATVAPPDVAEPARSPATPPALDEQQVAKAEDPSALARPEPPLPQPLPATPPPEAAAAEAPSERAERAPRAAPDAELLVAALARSALPVYVPPQRGAASVRIGGGTRSAHHELPRVLALAPEHEGLTVSESPTLYWFLSREASIPVEFVLTDPDRADPVIELQIEPPVASGIHSVQLDRLGVALEPSTAYRWFVSLVPDATRRSSDVIAGGVVRRIVPDAELEARLGAAGPDRVGHLYAERGLWYDALAFWSRWIAEAPDEPRLRAQRAALLEQAGLGAAAAQETQEGEGGAPG